LRECEVQRVVYGELGEGVECVFEAREAQQQLGRAELGARGGQRWRVARAGGLRLGVRARRAADRGDHQDRTQASSRESSSELRLMSLGSSLSSTVGIPTVHSPADMAAVTPAKESSKARQSRGDTPRRRQHS